MEPKMLTERVMSLLAVSFFVFGLPSLGWAEESLGPMPADASVIPNTTSVEQALQMDQGQPLPQEQLVDYTVMNQVPPAADSQVQPQDQSVMQGPPQGDDDKPPLPVIEPRPMPLPDENGNPPPSYDPPDVEIVIDFGDGTYRVGFTDEEGNRVYEDWCIEWYEEWLDRHTHPHPGDGDIIINPDVPDIG